MSRVSTLFERFQQTCAEDIPAYQTLVHEIQAAQARLEDLELVRSSTLVRLARACSVWQETGEGALDVLVLMRQALRTYGQRLSIPALLWQRLSRGGVFCSVHALETECAQRVELVADDWQTDWLESTAQIDHLHLRRTDRPATGDGLLYAMTAGAFWHYQSKAQQVATHASLFAEAGSTLLVMLPTGSGKSVVAQLPAWLDTQENGGTTLVVVPTVALALEQQIKALRYFQIDHATEYIPRSWTAQTPGEMREQIVREIKAGELPLLYVSPEALMQSRLYHICLQAAQEGKLRRLVIDEAHLVESWGAGFRTDFQFLSTYHTQLLACSQGRLQTLLLSATVSTSCARLLKHLFGGHGAFYEICAHRLRPEPGYWFSFAQQTASRERRVQEALHHLPRPLILYVSTRDDAEHWLHRLRQEGWRRLAAFTGETPEQERASLIHAWNADSIDLMIATSAFGLGVDKSDVRSIVHACLPESLERFYQEVGRAGRDGYSSISLVCTTIHDFALAKGMHRSARITTEKALARWEGMRQGQHFTHRERADVALVDLNALPAGSPDMLRSRANLSWNEHTLLLMQRAGLIQITGANQKVDVPEPVPWEQEQQVRARYLEITLLKPEVTAFAENEVFRTRLEEVRSLEREEIEENLRHMQRVIREYAVWQGQSDSQKHARQCLAHRLAQLYPYCALACGGCPFCRAGGQAPYVEPLSVEIEPELVIHPEVTICYELRQLLGSKAAMNVFWESGDSGPAFKEHLAQGLAGLVWAGVQQILLPDELLCDQPWMRDLLRQIAGSHTGPHQIAAHLAASQQIPLYDVPTVLVYPGHERDADYIHRRLHVVIEGWRTRGIPLIRVVARQLFLESEGGFFMDRVSGTSETLKNLVVLLERWQGPALF
jgi:ATP-dependent DNA helicase RecQ